MAIWSQIKEYVFRVLSAIGIYFMGRRAGAKDERNKQYRSDVEKARKIQDAADAARRTDGGGLSASERLRKYNRLRDWSDDL